MLSLQHTRPYWKAEVLAPAWLCPHLNLHSVIVPSLDRGR